MKTFLSYANENQKTAKTVAAILKQSGLVVWMDAESIKPGEVWRESIREGIKGCDAFVALLSQAYLDSMFCQMEFETALIFQKGDLIPIVIEDVWEAMAAHPVLHELYSYPPLAIENDTIVNASSRRPVELLDALKEKRAAGHRFRSPGPPAFDALLCSLPQDYPFAQQVAEELQRLGLTSFHVSDYAGNGDYIGQISYDAVDKAKHCVIILSEQGIRLHDVVGRFALASEEMGVPVYCVSSPGLHSNPDRMEQLYREINAMDRVFGRLLDRQVITAWGDARQVATELQAAFRSVNAGDGPENMGLLSLVLRYLGGKDRSKA